MVSSYPKVMGFKDLFEGRKHFYICLGRNSFDHRNDLITISLRGNLELLTRCRIQPGIENFLEGDTDFGLKGDFDSISPHSDEEILPKCLVNSVCH